MSGLAWREADRLEVTVLVDNYTDALLQSTEMIKRPPVAPTLPWPLAEHGLSCLLTVSAGAEVHRVLLDASVSPHCLFHNASLLKLDLGLVESLVLSHGHIDHYGGLLSALPHLHTGMSLLLHPDALLSRRLNDPALKQPREMGQLRLDELDKAHVALQQERGASTLAGGLVLVTGEVPRVTAFEKSLRYAEIQVEGNWVADPLRDDQALVVKIKNKGLVVITACAHAGVINTVKYAQQLAGTEMVYAVMGGFHLGGIPPDVMASTIQEMQRINPTYVVPMHCTGWKAMHLFAEAMPAQFLLNSVGTHYILS